MSNTRMSNTAADPLVRERVQRGRSGAIVVAVVLVATVLLAWLGAGAKQGFLDPEAYDAVGSRAVAALLEQQGVTVVKVRSTDDAVAAFTSSGAASTSLLVTNPDLLTAAQVKRLTTAGPDRTGPATTILVAPTGPIALDAWAPAVDPSDSATNDVREPDCSWRPAVLAGGARAGGVSYTIDASEAAAGRQAVEGCYLFEDDPTVINLVGPGDRNVSILGDPLVLTNDELPLVGNASLAVNALGQRSTLIWYLPSLAELDAAAGESFTDLIPDAVTFAVLQLAITVVLLALWRVRRLGPVVTEPLPVIVRSSETIEGRGRLYRRARARDRAAAALRAGAIERLRRRTGLATRCTPDMLVAAVSGRTARSGNEVRDLLYGGTPADDGALVRLADALDSLEREVART